MNKTTSGQRLLSMCLKLTVVISALIGTYLSASAGRGSFMGGGSVFMYFTIQSNIALAVLCAVGIYRQFAGVETSRLWQILHLMGAVSITLTGMVFCFVLAPTMGGKAWSLQNVLTHVVVPVAAVADFLATGSRSALRRWDAGWVIVPPLAYAIYAGIGYVRGWEFARGTNYPYFFLNWGSPAGAFGFTNTLPFMGCMWWILLLLAFLCAVGSLYLWLLNRK